MRDTALRFLYEQDTFAAIEYLSGLPDPVATVRLYSDLVHHLYWEKKDTHRMIVMAQAGIQYGLTAAKACDAQDTDRAGELRGIAKGLAYDLGSFTWPGWDEPGIEIAEAHLRFGLEAAQVNLRLAQELSKGDLPLSRAYWLLGAHFLAIGEKESATARFADATRHAQAAGADAEALLGAGYQCLVSVLASPDDATLRDNLIASQRQLAAMEKGAGLAEQLQTAWKVFAD